MKITLAIVIALLVLLGFNSVYTVEEGQSALVLQLGRIVRVDHSPGLHAKFPLLQQVTTIDQRVLAFDASPARYTTADKQTVNVDVYVKWRVADPQAYYRITAADDVQASQRLNPVVSNAVRDIVQVHSLQQLVAANDGDFTTAIQQAADKQAQSALGINVTDVRITSVEFPDDIKAAVYKRMQTERQQQASAIRADGKQEAESIKADGDRQAQVIRANANSDAEKVRGEGDAQAAQVYAASYAEDPDFFAFYRSLSAYKKALGDGKTIIVLKPDSEFMRYFDNPAAAGKH